MINVSDTFKATLNKSHRMIVDVEIIRNGVIIWDGNIADGNLGMDQDAMLLRSADLTINQDKETMSALIPAFNTDLLAPFGIEVRLHRGVQYVDGTQELCPLGRVVVEKTRTIDSGQGLQLKLSCKDLGYKMGKNRFWYTYTVPAGQWYGTALKNLVDLTAPWAQWQPNAWAVIPAVYTTSAIAFDAAGDPFEAAYKLAQDAGYRLYFNEYGLLDLSTLPAEETLNNPVWDLVEGTGGTLLYIDKEFTVETTYNRVVVTGTPTNAAPVYGVADDTDPSSPTYINGPFGIVPYFYSSPFITTVAQATQVAQSLLWRKLGGQENMHIQALPAPMLVPDDIVLVQRDVSNVNSNYRINKLSVPLTSDRAMDINMSTRRISV